MMRERELIAAHFGFAGNDSVLVGVGDDAAVVRPPAGATLATSVDTLTEGTHFFADAAPYFLARKAAAVSLSDLAAMGAQPLWMLVALTAVQGGEWMRQFADGMRAMADEFSFAIIGGDLTRGDKVSITTTAIGALSCPPLLRSGAKAGDDLWLSGQVGEAALAVQWRQGKVKLSAEHIATVCARLDNPMPRVALGLRLRGLATAAMDLSDGLTAAAEEIATAAKVAVSVHCPLLPLPPALAALSQSLRQELMLTGGDDYELLFTAPPQKQAEVKAVDDGLCRIGEISGGAGVNIFAANGEKLPLCPRGYEHNFATADGAKD